MIIGITLWTLMLGCWFLGLVVTLRRGPRPGRVRMPRGYGRLACWLRYHGFL